MENCNNFKLKNQILGKCTSFGAMKTDVELLKQYYDEYNIINNVEPSIALLILEDLNFIPE